MSHQKQSKILKSFRYQKGEKKAHAILQLSRNNRGMKLSRFEKEPKTLQDKVVKLEKQQNFYNISKRNKEMENKRMFKRPEDSEKMLH